MSKTGPAALELHKLTKNYGRNKGIEDITLRVETGEVFGFLGPNGAGKSTTINTILNLLQPDGGTATIFGKNTHTNDVEVRRTIGYLSGDMITDPHLTGTQYLKYAAALHDVPVTLADPFIKRLHCDTTKKIRHLSRGNRQKIGLIAALMHDPELLILDEPTSGLDPLIQSEFNEIIRERKKQGKTTFMSSHILNEVQNICDRVGFIREGKLIKVSSLTQLIAEAPRRVQVVFNGPAPDGKLKRLAGVEHITGHNSHRHFTYRGDYNALVHLLAASSISDLQILEPSLDELFMDYYKAEDPNV